MNTEGGKCRGETPDERTRQYERSGSLSDEEWRAIHRGQGIPVIRTGPEWTDCTNCDMGIKTMNLAGLIIQGRCCCCAGTGRVLAKESAGEAAK